MTALLTTTGCVAHPARPATMAERPGDAPAGAPDDTARMARYHSKRLGLSVPLPDGSAWRIDDHSHPHLVATHARTRSRVVIAAFHADAVVGRTQCEELARARKLVPLGDLRTVEDAVAITQQSFDTRVWVTIQPGGGTDGSLVGHVMAFGGFLRKCYVFDYSTAVDGAADEPILSSRLAFARTRILDGLELDASATAPSGRRAAPVMPVPSQAQ